MKLVAILSTTVLPLDGTYSVVRVDAIDIKGVPHYIGHPATKQIVETLGSVQSESKLFEGLQEGESALACSIKQGQSSRATVGHTEAHQEITIDQLDFRLITRVPHYVGGEKLYYCGVCGS